MSSIMSSILFSTVLRLLFFLLFCLHIRILLCFQFCFQLCNPYCLSFCLLFLIKVCLPFWLPVCLPITIYVLEQHPVDSSKNYLPFHLYFLLYCIQKYVLFPFASYPALSGNLPSQRSYPQTFCNSSFRQNRKFENRLCSKQFLSFNLNSRVPVSRSRRTNLYLCK